MSASATPPSRILFATLALGLLAGWVMLRAYTNPTSTDCLERYHAARTAADTAKVDSLVPETRTGNSQSCGFLRVSTWWGYAASVGQDSTLIRQIALGIIAADNRSDIASVLGYYGDSAVLVPPDGPEIAGIRAIRSRYEQLFHDFSPAIDGRIDSIVVRDTTAVVWGHNTGWLRAIAAGLSDRALTDDYLMRLEFKRGAWQISRLEWHSTPSPTMR